MRGACSPNGSLIIQQYLQDHASPSGGLFYNSQGGAMTNQTKPGSEVQGSEASVTTRRDSTPTLFADGLLGGSIESGVVRLELLARHLDPDSKSLSAALVGRL